MCKLAMCAKARTTMLSSSGSPIISLVLRAILRITDWSSRMFVRRRCFVVLANPLAELVDFAPHVRDGRVQLCRLAEHDANARCRFGGIERAAEYRDNRGG